MVDVDRIEARLQHLEELIERLDEVRQEGEEAYLADSRQRAATERWLQLAIQICIDLGAQLVAEQSVRPPSDYSDIFAILGEREPFRSNLATRLGGAARQRNLIVHLYMEIDDRAVFASLAFLDDLRAFAAAVETLASAADPGSA